MIFFAAASCMVLIAALVLALPLWRARIPESTGAVAANRQVHAARLKELETDLEAGRLSQVDHAAARRDLEMDLTSSTGDGHPSSAPKPQRLWAAIATIFVIALTSGLYWSYGNWRVGAQGVEAASAQAVIDMVDKLAKRLKTPEGQGDLQGWDMLGHSYVIMGRYADAAEAFDHARKLTNDANPLELASYAEARTLTDPDSFMDKTLPLFEKVLQMDPSNTQALWYGGLGALQRGDQRLAIQRWNAILAQNPPADYRAYIEKAIADAGGTPAAAVAGVSISVHVSLAPALAAQASPGDTVFVYARPADGEAGPPLAAKRLQVRDLPVDLKLSDQDAVVPGRVISAYAAVTVIARVSKSGTAAAPHDGDLLGQQGWKKASGKPLAIVIDTVLK